MARTLKAPVAEKEAALSKVAEAAKESAKAALAKPDALDAPPAAPAAQEKEKPSRRKPKSAPEGFCYGLIFGKSLKIKKTFESMDAALDHVRAMPMAKAREVKLVSVQPLKVELRVEIADAVQEGRA